MADQENAQDMDIKLLKKTLISVFVDEAVPDILVVTYSLGVKIFRGVLIDSTKRNLPCGVPNINPAFNIPSKNPDDDTLYSVNQRFGYLDPNSQKKKNVQISSKYKNNKMTVRLRPRQVLCSKCKGICNENSENVSRKRKSSDTTQNIPLPPKRANNAPITRSVHSILNTRKTMQKKETSSVSRLTRLSSQESNLEDSKTSSNTSIDNNTNKKPLGNVQEENLQPETEKKHSLDHSSSHSCNTEDTEQMPTKLRKVIKKKKISTSSSTEEKEKWVENSSVPEIDNRNDAVQTSQNSQTNSTADTTKQPLNTSNSTTPSSTRTIKISYGPQGEGTVLKIPAQIENIVDDEIDDSEENINVSPQLKIKEMHTKAARRALKRAKKEARRKVLVGGSPLYLSGTSPRYTLGGASPRYTLGNGSPRQALGNNSPRYMVAASYEFNLPRRRKHKVKHKKKHKDEKDRKYKEGEVSSTQDDSKEQCITQKLSINLKRLHNSHACGSEKIEDMSSSDEHSETVPNFPPSNPPLMLRINSQTVTSALGADGVRLLVGDVVWGKIHGFPWWPGKILTMTNSSGQGAQAHVAWYGSSTSSLMQCDQLSHYLDNFKIRYNKKKKGPYKEAIKQATTEARENAENRIRQPLGNSPSHNIIQVVPPALASPREIDVAS